MSRGQRVIVVDGVPETAQVLREVFGPRGHRVERIRGFEVGSVCTTDGVLVIHDDGGGAPQLCRGYGSTPRVVIAALTTDPATEPAVGERRLLQPFHYAELICAVETLLGNETMQWAAA